MSLIKDKATYPENHQVGMRTPKGGASCANCSYLAANQKDCANKYFIAWNDGDPRIPFPADEYTSDWYEPASKSIDASRKLEGRTEFRGLDISIETDKGSIRKGIGKDGKPWAVRMSAPYGYILGGKLVSSFQNFVQRAVTDTDFLGDGSDTLSFIKRGVDYRPIISVFYSAISDLYMSESEGFGKSTFRNSEFTSDESLSKTLFDEFLSIIKIPTKKTFGGIEPFFSKASTDCIATYTYLFGNGSTGVAIRSKGFDSLDVEEKKVVQTCMISVFKDEKIFRSIIKLLPIVVVNIFIGEQFSADDVLHNCTMFLNRLSTSLDNSIWKFGSILIDSISSCLPLAFACWAAKEAFTSGEFGTVAFQGLATELAKNDGHLWSLLSDVNHNTTEGVDGDKFDCFLGPNEDAENVYVINTKEPTTDKFDEQKAMLGFDSAESAKKAFLENYSDPKFFGSMDTLPFEKFKEKVLQTKDDPQRIAAYGTSEGVQKEWDERGRKLYDKLIGSRNPADVKSLFDSVHDKADESNMAVARKLYEETQSRLAEFSDTIPLYSSDRTGKGIETYAWKPWGASKSPGTMYEIPKDRILFDYVGNWPQGSWGDQEVLVSSDTPNWLESKKDVNAAIERLDINAAIADLLGLGTSEGAEKGWDERGRKLQSKTISKFGVKKIGGSGFIFPDGISVAGKSHDAIVGMTDPKYIAMQSGVRKFQQETGAIRVFNTSSDVSFQTETDNRPTEAQFDEMANLAKGKIVFWDTPTGSGKGSFDMFKDFLLGYRHTHGYDPSFHQRDVEAEALFRGVKVLGFTGPEEEFVNATVSRVPPELLENVKSIIAAPWLGAKHGQYMPDEKIIYLNPKNARTRVRLGQGQGWISHGELTTVHEIMHSVYDNLPEEEQDKWMAVSGWMIGTKDGQAPAYVEKRPGWEPFTSKWTHKTGVKFPRIYAEKSPDEDFADCGAFYLLNKAHQIGTKKKAFLDGLFSKMVKNYPNYNVQSPEKPYGEKHVAWALNALDISAAIADLLSSGTSEGAEKGWDSRGRGRNLKPRPLPEIPPPPPEKPEPITAIRTDDGSIYWSEASSFGTPDTHYSVARALKIPPERIVGGGFIVNGVYDENSYTDAARLGERARAALKLGRPMDLDAYGTSEGLDKAWDTRGRGRKEEVHSPSLAAVVEWQDNPHMLYNLIEDEITGSHNHESDMATQQDKQNAAEILDGIRYGDTFGGPLYRGMHIDPNNDAAGLLKMKEGDEFQITRPASFSQHLGIASGFSYGVSKSERNVLFITDGESQGLDVSKVNQHSADIGYGEDEVVTEGKFRVTRVEDSKNYGPTIYHKIYVQQLGVY